MSFIRAWKVADAFVSSNGITRNSGLVACGTSSSPRRRSTCALDGSRAEIEFGEEPCAMELVQKFLGHWDRELIVNGDGVWCVVVNAEAPCAIGLLDEERRRRERRGAQVNNAFVEHLGVLALQFILLGGMGTPLQVGRRSRGECGDHGVVGTASRWV